MARQVVLWPFTSEPHSPAQGLAENSYWMPHCHSLLCSLPSSWGGRGTARQTTTLQMWGFPREMMGTTQLWWSSSMSPAGPVILQTATTKNDLQALANFSILLDSLESYLALRKNADGQIGLLSRCMEFGDCRSESWNLQCCQCWCFFFPDSP